MYRKPKFLEALHAVREQMARECDYDMDLFIQMLRRESPPDENLSDKTSSEAPPSVPSSRKARVKRKS
ncbi:MAG: hypothetical protein N0A16_10830 [Blastocatellia bacterium]|nr:hypothetical protein [Blastocatellia bacterium]